MELRVFCNRAIDLQEKYQKEHDRGKLEILSRIVKEAFRRGKLPYSFDIEYPVNNTFDIIEEEKIKTVIEDLSIEYNLDFHEKSMTIEDRKFKARFIRKKS